MTPSEVRLVSARAPILRPGERYPGTTGGRPFTRAHLPEGGRAGSAREIADRTRDWVTIRWAAGTKGPLEGRFARRKVRVRAAQFPTDGVGWLLMEDHPDGLKTWMCWGLPNARIDELVAIAHARWPIERFHEEAKMELGLDHLEGRRWRGLNHHATITPMTHTFLVLEQQRAREEGHDEEEIPTLAEMRRAAIREIIGALLKSMAIGSTEEARLLAAQRVTEKWSRVA